MDTLREKGFKSTTMDLVAARLQISKRTLYEIFDSKNEMLVRVLDYVAIKQSKEFEAIYNEAPNILVALLNIFRIQREQMSSLSESFFKDLDRLYAEVRPHYNERRRKNAENIAGLIEKGIDQGLFRKDLNTTILSRMFLIQMEALKRSEELFPHDITLSEIYDQITHTFFRGIATPKGMKILDDFESGRG